MTCIECDQPIIDCQCSDIEDRLRTVIATGNSFARRAAQMALYERLSKVLLPADTETWTEENFRVFEFALDRAYAEHMAKRN